MGNITKFQKQILIGIVSVVFLFLNIFMFFSPLVKEVGELRKISILNSKRIDGLRNTEEQKESLKEKEKFYKNELFGIGEKLPSYLAPEKYISALKFSALENKLKIADVSFTKPEEYDFPDIKPNFLASGPLAQQADSIIVDLFSNDDGKGIKATNNELQVDNISDEKPIKVDVDFSFTGDYYQIKGFINSIESNLSSLSSIIIDTVSMAPSKDNGIINGKMTISLFGFKDSKIPVYNFWDKDLQRGKGNLFGKGSSNRYNIDDTDVSDFDIALNPYASDYPTVIMRKHGTFASAVYGDGKGIEQVELQIVEKDGQVSYRYKTLSTSYPLNYSYTQFKPVISNNVFVKVYSKPRVNDADNAGINLTINKPAGIDAKVQVYNDDQVKPRVTYQIK